MAESKTGRGADQFPLRLPDGMRDRIKTAAADNNRSMNAEIVDTLEEKYPGLDKNNLFVNLIAAASEEMRWKIIDQIRQARNATQSPSGDIVIDIDDLISQLVSAAPKTDPD